MSSNSCIKIPKQNNPSLIKELFSERKPYVFLVGAGISMDPPSCVPSARKFVKELFNHYAPSEEISELISLENLRYEFLVEKLQNLIDKDILFLDYLEGIKEPNINHIFLANMIMRYNYVITTNFDYLIERAMKDILSIFPLYDTNHQKFMIIITKDDYNKNVKLKFPVIKIHGSKRNCITGKSTKESLITTLSALGKDREKGKTFAIEPYKKRLIEDIIFNRDLVVMGYSGSDDFDITPMIKEVEGIKRIIWIDHDQNMIHGDEVISKYLPHQNQERQTLDPNLNKLDKILIELASTKNIEIFKINAKTIDFVKNHLGPIFKINLKDQNKSIRENFLSFKEYMEQNHIKVSKSTKYRLANEIYYDLSHIEGVERTILKGLDQSKEEGNLVNQIYFINALGLLFVDQGRYDQSISHFDRALQICREQSLENEQLGIILNLSNVYSKKGDLKKAMQYVFDASSLIKENTPFILRFSILNGLGVLYRDLGDNDNATKNIELALKIAENVGDLFRKAVCLNNLAGIKLSQGSLNPALQYSLEALKIDEQLGDLNDMSNTLNTIGNIFRIAGKYEQAIDYLQKANKISTKIENLRGKAIALNSIGVIFLQLKRYDEALKKLNEAFLIRKKIGDFSGQATSLNNLGILYRTNGDFQKAKNHFKQSIEISEQIGEKKHLGVRYSNLASIYEANKNFQEALQVYQKALSFEQSQKNMEGIARQLNNIAGILGDLGQYDDCIAKYIEALQIWESLEIKPGIANTSNNLGVVYFKYKRNYEKGIEYLEKALQIFEELNIPNMIYSTRMNLEQIRKSINQS